MTELEARDTQRNDEIERRKQQIAQELARTTSASQEARTTMFNKFMKQNHPDKNQETDLARDIGNTVIQFLVNQREVYINNQGEYVDEITPKAKGKPRPEAATPPR